MPPCAVADDELARRSWPSGPGASMEIGPVNLAPGSITVEPWLQWRQFEPPRPKRKLDDVTRPRESLVEVLMQAVVGRHIGEGRAPRSNRRVVRAAWSRRVPDPEPEPPLALRPRRAVSAATSPTVADLLEADDVPFGNDGPLPEAPLVVPSPEDPMAVARAFLEERYMRGGDVLLRHHRGSFHRWTGTSWPEDEERRVKSELYNWLEGALFHKARETGGKTNWTLEPFRPNARRWPRSHVAHRDRARLGGARPPLWLDGGMTGEAGASGVSGVSSTVDATGVVAMANGLLHLSTRTLEPHRPAFFNEHSLPFAYEPKAPKPKRWLRFLHQLWGDDEEAIAYLAEVMGYVLSGETNQQKIAMLVGPMRSGKGTIGRVLTGLLGAHNVAAPTLASLSQNFGLQVLVGKPLALISDARLSNGPTAPSPSSVFSLSRARTRSRSTASTATHGRAGSPPVSSS